MAGQATQHPCGSQPISQNLHWKSTHNFAEEANVRNWQECGRHALNFQQASFERAAQECEQAARGEVHVAVAQATERSGAEVREHAKVKQSIPGRPIKVHFFE